MAPPDRHTAPYPLTAYLDQVKEDIIAGVADLLSDRRPTLDLQELGIVPLRAYSAEEVAELLGVARINSIYEIPETELPRVRRIGRLPRYQHPLLHALPGAGRRRRRRGGLPRAPPR